MEAGSIQVKILPCVWRCDQKQINPNCRWHCRKFNQSSSRFRLTIPGYQWKYHDHSTASIAFCHVSWSTGNFQQQSKLVYIHIIHIKELNQKFSMKSLKDPVKQTQQWRPWVDHPGVPMTDATAIVAPGAFASLCRWKCPHLEEKDTSDIWRYRSLATDIVRILFGS